MFNIPQGSRKITAFFITILLYTLLAGTALLIGAGKGIAFDSFVFQLAGGYAAISGLFFTGNVLEHYTRNGNKQ